MNYEILASKIKSPTEIKRMLDKRIFVRPDKIEKGVYLWITWTKSTRRYPSKPMVDWIEIKGMATEHYAETPDGKRIGKMGLFIVDLDNPEFKNRTRQEIANWFASKSKFIPKDCFEHPETVKKGRWHLDLNYKLVEACPNCCKEKLFNVCRIP